jgi:hypothetical protein
MGREYRLGIRVTTRRERHDLGHNRCDSEFPGATASEARAAGQSRPRCTPGFAGARVRLPRMTAAALDTLKVVKTLQASGMPEAQAEAVLAVMREATDTADLVTRKDLQIELQKELAPIKTEIASVKADIVLLKWMMGVGVASSLALVAKAFFHV